VGVIKIGAFTQRSGPSKQVASRRIRGANGPAARCVGNRYHGDANMQLPKELDGARANALYGVTLGVAHC